MKIIINYQHVIEMIVFFDGFFDASSLIQAYVKSRRAGIAAGSR